MRIWYILLLSLLLPVTIVGIQPEFVAASPAGIAGVKLWPAKAPGSEQVRLKEQVIERSKQSGIYDRAVTGITEPEIIPVLADPARANGTAVLICPGGAYARVTIDKEGYDIAEWLNKEGISAFILKYRLPGEGHAQQYAVPLQDAQRAMRLIRARAAEWKVDPKRIGVMGFSAGGHLASTLGTRYQDRVYSPVDAADQQSAKPAFMVLLYPVISMEDSVAHAASKQNLLGDNPDTGLIHDFSSDEQVRADTPPTFIVQAHNDGVSTENSIRFYSALKQAEVPAELHIFTKGGHGFGIRGAKGPIAIWPHLCKAWMQEMQFIPAE